MTTRDVDKGRKRVRALMRELDAGAVSVGAMDGENAAKLTFAEFGTATAPARPVVRATLDAGRSKYARLMEAALFRAVDGKSNARRALDAVGRVVADDLKKAILTWSDPPNAPETIRQKGKDDPLVDTGDLVRGIVYKVKV